MKIAIDIRPIGQQRTGDEVYTLNLIQNLMKIDSDNFYFLLTNTRDKEKIKKIEEKIFKGVDKNFYKNYKIISITPASKFLWTFFLLPIWIFRNKIDILHVQYIVPLILSKKTKLITTIHDVSFCAYPEFIKKSDLFFLKILIPFSLKRADKIIAVSKFTKKEIIKYYKTNKEKVSMIYNGGASKEYFQKYTKDQERFICEKYKITKPFIFYIGTLQPRKNIPFLLEAYQFFEKKYSKENPEIKKTNLYITGNENQHNFDKEIKNTLEKIKREDAEVFDKIKLLGFVDGDDLPIILQMSDLVILVSFYEGFGLPALEAMASGTSLVLNNKSCLGEIAGNSALIYEQGSKKDLAKKIFEAIIKKESRRDLISKGRNRSLYFNWEKCAKKTLDLYNLLNKTKNK